MTELFMLLKKEIWDVYVIAVLGLAKIWSMMKDVAIDVGAINLCLGVVGVVLLIKIYPVVMKMVMTSVPEE